MKPKIFSTLALLFLLFVKVHAQPADSTLSRYATSFQPEKVYIHFDQASYFPGQTVWFKAYVTENGLPASSKNFYADWITDDGKVLNHTVAPMVDGITSGQFDVPDDYTGKFIQLRAYTKWMLNFDSAFLYSKDIRIIPATSAAAKPAKPVITTTLQFFPEGGDMINGILNKIAFKATDQWGRPSSIKGVIVDKKGNKLDSIRTLHDGMGYFKLTPAADNAYVAKWIDSKGVEISTNLPLAKTDGVSMQLVVSGKKRIVNLQASGAGANQPLYMVGTLNQQQAFKATVNLSATGAAKKLIPTESLVSGILTITLFDASWNAIAERITFINNEEYRFAPQIEVTHWGLSKRGRNELQVSVPDSITGANLSIAVTDASIDTDSTENIYSGLLLTNDIKGYVFNPAYYFSNTSDSVQQNLDLVMLTNGWRRFKWENVLKGKLPAIIYPKDSEYLSLSGAVFGVPKSMLTGKESILLLVKGKDSGSTKTLIMPLSSNGTFNNPELVFFDTLRVYYQLKSKLFTTGEARFMTGRLPAPNYLAASKSFVNRRSFLDTTGYYRHYLLANELLKSRVLEKGKMLETVTVKAKAKTPVQELDEKYAKGLFGGGDATQFDLIHDPFAASAMNIFTYLQGKVAGLQISGGNPPSLSWRGGEPKIYLDEMPMDAEYIANLPVTDVAYIKVFRPPFFGPGTGGGNGAISIYTRRGSDLSSQPGKGLSSSMVMGYTPIREFYSPNYSRFDAKNEQRDIRTTLYWNPLVLANKGKPVKLSFYNNDVTKSFRIVITGMTKDGMLTQYQEIME